MSKFVKVVTSISLLVVLSLLWTACTVAIAPQSTTLSETEGEVLTESMGIEIQPIEPHGLAGIGPDDAIAPTGQWTTLERGEYHWFTFHFDYDEDVTEPIEIQMYTEPRDSAILKLLDREQAQLWRTEGELDDFGSATVKEYDPEKEERPEYAHWSGRLYSTGTYYIVIEHSRDIQETAMYRFTMSGPNLSFPEVEAEPVAVIPSEVAAPAVEIEARQLTGLEGSGPDHTLAPTGEWTAVKSGEYHWYAFNYDFDEDYDNIEIRMYTEPEDGAVLLPLNREQAQLWRTEGKLEHFGCCTVEPSDEELEGDNEPDYTHWSGQLFSTGTYYIVVQTAENVAGPVAYRFTIEGEGVSY